MKRDSLASSGNRKESQTQGIKDLDGTLHFGDERVPKKCNQPSDHRQSNIPPVSNGGGRDRPDEHVTHNSPGSGRDERQYEHAKNIDSVLHARCCPADCENEGPDQIEHLQKFTYEDLFVNSHKSYHSSQAEEKAPSYFLHRRFANRRLASRLLKCGPPSMPVRCTGWKSRESIWVQILLPPRYWNVLLVAFLP